MAELPNLEHFETRASDDPVKADLELFCTECSTHLCDVEATDTLQILVAVAQDHAQRICPAVRRKRAGR